MRFIEDRCDLVIELAAAAFLWVISHPILTILILAALVLHGKFAISIQNEDQEFTRHSRTTLFQAKKGL